MYTCKFIGNWDQAHANVNPLFNMVLWKKENFKVKYYFYDQSYQFSEVLFLMCMLHFPKRSSGTPGDNNNNLFQYYWQKMFKTWLAFKRTRSYMYNVTITVMNGHFCKNN